MHFFDRFLRRTILILSVVGAVCLVGITATVVSNVILRPLGHSILGTVEIVELVVVPMVAFGLGYTAIKRAHISVTLVTSHLSPSLNRILTIITTFLSISILAIITWRSYVVASTKVLPPELSDILEWPVYPMRYIMVLGFTILCLVVLTDLVRAFKKVKSEVKDSV
ncbi:TRAP transporter small permease [Chloroflexota bacterium]